MSATLTKRRDDRGHRILTPALHHPLLHAGILHPRRNRAIGENLANQFQGFQYRLPHLGFRTEAGFRYRRFKHALRFRHEGDTLSL